MHAMHAIEVPVFLVLASYRLLVLYFFILAKRHA